MEFCPKCKVILKIKSEDGQKCWHCEDCGFQKCVIEHKVSEKVKKSKEIDIVTDEIHPLANYPHKCPKCGYGKAQMISKGIWYSDEDEVIEYVCGKCGFHEKDPDQKIT